MTDQKKQWPKLKQPFTNNLMDAILRDKSDAELDAVIKRGRSMTEKPTAEDWFWAADARRGQPAGDRFIIERGKDAFWYRVRSEIDQDEHCFWLPVQPVQRLNQVAQIEDILDMMLTVVPTYGVNLNRFVFEAAKIPVFAKFLRHSRSDICNYVSNSLFPDHQPVLERYSDKNMRRLGGIVSRTLRTDEDWF